MLIALARTGMPDALSRLASAVEHGFLGFPRGAPATGLLLAEAAERGFGPAMHKLAESYLRGENGLAQDGAQAMRWWHRASDEHNDTCAAGALGAEYLKSSLVPRDTAKVHSYFKMVVANPYASTRELAEQQIRLLDAMEGQPEVIDRRVDDKRYAAG
jgi:TPR repeat protein